MPRIARRSSRSCARSRPRACRCASTRRCVRAPSSSSRIPDPDWAERGALIASLADQAGEHVVALASYARLRDPAAAEVAFAVADELQGVGVGTRLLEQLAARAAARGVERLVFDILPANHRMLAVVAGAGLPVTQRFIGGLVEATMRIEPTGEYLVHVDRRDHVAVAASLRGFMEPASVAVYGASPRRGTIGGELFRNVLAAGFEGPAYPLNREGAEVGGVPGRTSLAGVEPPVDLAVICVRPWPCSMPRLTRSPPACARCA